MEELQPAPCLPTWLHFADAPKCCAEELGVTRGVNLLQREFKGARDNLWSLVLSLSWKWRHHVGRSVLEGES